MNRIEQAFQTSREQGRAAFVAYLCAGDPDFDTSLDACRTVIESGIDILELGIPFTDPLADGLTNQLAAQRALESGTDTKAVLRLVRAIREFSEVPIVFYTYYNMVFAQGGEPYLREIKEAGVDGLLTLDLPPEESAGHLDTCRELGLGTVYIVAPTTPEARLPLICDVTTAFVYYVSREGVTGERDRVADDIRDRVKLIKKHTQFPVVVGFGISTGDHVRAVAAAADGVVVGSAIVNCIARNLGNRDQTIAALKEKMAELCSPDNLVAPTAQSES